MKLKHLELSDEQSGDGRAVFLILRKSRPGLPQEFGRAIERKPELKALSPMVNGDYVSAQMGKGVADAMDKIIGDVHQLLDHCERIQREISEAKAERDADELRTFKQENGLS